MPAVHAGAAAFSGAGDAYERGRPTYPADAVAWMAMSLGIDADARVVDLAAGTGKFTRVLSPFAPRLVALEPLELRPRQRLELGLEDRHGTDYSWLASASWIDPKEAACARRS